jgi:hypothetical protein
MASVRGRFSIAVARFPGDTLQEFPCRRDVAVRRILWLAMVWNRQPGYSCQGINEALELRPTFGAPAGVAAKLSSSPTPYCAWPAEAVEGHRRTRART